MKLAKLIYDEGLVVNVCGGFGVEVVDWITQ